MSRETRNKVNMVWRYVILLAVGVVMVYPLVWMIGASFMTNDQRKLYTKIPNLKWLQKRL